MVSGRRSRGPTTGTRMILPLAAKYRDDEVAKEAWRLAEETRCILSFERSFMRPVLAAEP